MSKNRLYKPVAPLPGDVGNYELVDSNEGPIGEGNGREYWTLFLKRIQS